jgi:putative addiction module killer protein
MSAPMAAAHSLAGSTISTQLPPPESCAPLRVEQGNLSSVKSVGGGVLEFRIDFGPGYRIYFGRDGEQLVILLAGGTKKRQPRDIDAAIRFWQEYKRARRAEKWTE